MHRWSQHRWYRALVRGSVIIAGTVSRQATSTAPDTLHLRGPLSCQLVHAHRLRQAKRQGWPAPGVSQVMAETAQRLAEGAQALALSSGEPDSGTMGPGDASADALRAT
jgi:hypothetical protein